jgi:hypothetical protein
MRIRCCNDAKDLKSREWVEFTCEECGQEVKKQVRSIHARLLCKGCQVKESLSRVDFSVVLDRRKKTCLEKYGVEHTLQSKEHKEKSRKTCLEKYGREHFSGSQEWATKTRDTCLKRYGVENVLQNETIKTRAREASKKTCLEKYGVDTPLKSQEIREKRDRTMLERYGTTNPVANQEIAERRRATIRERFGFDSNLSSESNRDKIRETCLEKYGVDWSSKSPEVREKMKKTLNKNYGVDCCFSSPEVRARIIKTLEQRYGVSNACFISRCYEYDNVHFDSSWELGFYIYCKDHNDSICRNQQPIQLKNGKNFYPDFIVNEQLVEIKGNWLMEKEDWKWKKLACDEHNVRVISGSEISRYLSYVKNKYGKDYMKQFRSKNED